jgi:hypothetical protein
MSVKAFGFRFMSHLNQCRKTIGAQPEPPSLVLCYLFIDTQT